MRTKGAKTTKNCWKVKITQGDIVLHDAEYSTLRDGADALGLSYSQICELGPNGRNKKKSIRFKFMPTIEITKIGAIEVSPTGGKVETETETEIETV